MAQRPAKLIVPVFCCHPHVITVDKRPSIPYNSRILCKGFAVSNLLLITDVARLRRIFARLTEDKNIRLRVVNNLEKGGEEIAIEKPDVVFVQTHLSGLSSDILIMHLKKQLGRKRSRFVLLASPTQINDAALKPYQGWLDTSAEDGQLLADLQLLLTTLLSKPKKNEEPAPPEQLPATDFTPQPVSNAESSALLVHQLEPETALPQQVDTRLQFPVAVPDSPEPTLEEQGVTYAPRQRLKVYSEFNSSFDSAVSNAPDAESLEQATPVTSHEWDAEDIETIETKPARSKKGTFLLWLIPVVLAVVAITFFQQRAPDTKPQPVSAKAAPLTPPPASPATAPAKPPTDAAASPATPQGQDKLSDKAVLTSIAENQGPKSPAAVAATPAAGRLTNIPDFIPGYGFDKKYGIANPGWELYKGQVTEFKVLREARTIKAIQVIDRGGEGVPESFMKGVLRQVAKNPSFSAAASEKKDGYEIKRGKVSENINIVYYRDEDGGKLRAFVLTWQ